ncbi:hypothetical protein HMPREF9154_2105 [Arachnia propionica F0230a]|nr:hypothetical protein HMPREF9154_2105 [Arachnia propionica F0230a]
MSRVARNERPESKPPRQPNNKPDHKTPDKVTMVSTRPTR